SEGYTLATPVKITVDKAVVDLGDIAVVMHTGTHKSIQTSISEVDVSESLSISDEMPHDSGVPGLLLAARDPFLAAAAFTFGAWNYRLRGYGRDQTSVYINGMLM